MRRQRDGRRGRSDSDDRLGGNTRFADRRLSATRDADDDDFMPPLVVRRPTTPRPSASESSLSPGLVPLPRRLPTSAAFRNRLPPPPPRIPSTASVGTTLSLAAAQRLVARVKSALRGVDVTNAGRVGWAGSGGGDGVADDRSDRGLRGATATAAAAATSVATQRLRPANSRDFGSSAVVVRKRVRSRSPPPVEQQQQQQQTSVAEAPADTGFAPKAAWISRRKRSDDSAADVGATRPMKTGRHALPHLPAPVPPPYASFDRAAAAAAASVPPPRPGGSVPTLPLKRSPPPLPSLPLRTSRRPPPEESSSPPPPPSPPPPASPSQPASPLKRRRAVVAFRSPPPPSPSPPPSSARPQPPPVAPSGDARKDERARDRVARLERDAAAKKRRADNKAHAAALFAAMSAVERAAHLRRQQARRVEAKRRRDAIVAERRAAAAAVEERNRAVMRRRFAAIADRVRGYASYVYASYSIRADRMSTQEFEFHRRHLTVVPQDKAAGGRAMRRDPVTGALKLNRAMAMRDANAREQKTLRLYGNNADTKAPDDPFMVRMPREYARRCFGAAEVNVQSRGLPLAPGLAFSGALWGPDDPFDQRFVVDLVVRHLAAEKRGGILELPTSCGKTILMIWIVVVLLRRRALIVLPMLALHTQFMMRLESFVPGLRVGSIQGETYDVAGCDVVVAMVHTLANTPAIMQRPEMNDFGIVLFDEIDRFATPGFSLVVASLAHIYWMFAFTATLERSDQMDRMFDLYFGYPIYSAPRSTKQNRLTTVVRLRYDDGDHSIVYRETRDQKRAREAREQDAADAAEVAAENDSSEAPLEGAGDDAEEQESMAEFGDDSDLSGYSRNGGSGGGQSGGGDGSAGNEQIENGEIDTQAMLKRLTTDETRHALLMRLLLLLLARGRRVAVLVTDIEYARRILDECAREFPAKRMVHYASTLSAVQRQDIDEEPHELIVASFAIFSIGIDLAYLDTLVFAMPRRTITQAAGRLRAVARGFVRQPLFIYDLVDAFGMFAAQARARNQVYHQKRFSMAPACTLAAYVDAPEFPEIVPLSPEDEMELDEELRLEEEARQEAIAHERQQFFKQLANVRRLHPPPVPLGG